MVQYTTCKTTYTTYVVYVPKALMEWKKEVLKDKNRKIEIFFIKRIDNASTGNLNNIKSTNLNFLI